MIWNVTGQLELLICSECKERWIGQTNEPRTQEWMQHHTKHVGSSTVGKFEPVGLGPTNPDAPKGFDAQSLLGP